MPLKTRQVAKLLGVNYYSLVALFRSGKCDPPEKDASGDFVWTEADIGRAHAALKIDLRRKFDRQKNQAPPVPTPRGIVSKEVAGRA
jgi:hypothetical protein